MTFRLTSYKSKRNKKKFVKKISGNIKKKSLTIFINYGIIRLEDKGVRKNEKNDCKTNGKSVS